MRPRVISLYTGVGGLDFGFEAAGFRTAAAVELDDVCCKTLRKNRSAWSLISGDINATSTRKILRAGGLRKGEAEVLIGGPPCQPFSKSGYWATGDAGRLEDPRSSTLDAYLRVLEEAKPKAFLLENVRGLAYSGKDEGLRLLLEGIDQINHRAKTNYSVAVATLNAADYGVPQHRERVFLVGSRDGKPFTFPSPRFGGDRDDFTLESYRTAWDALGDVPADLDDSSLHVGGKWGDLLPTIPEGENYLHHTERGRGFPLFGWRRRYWSFLLKLAKNRPSWTIQAQPGTATGPFHWKSRRLSTRELCRLQTVPDDVEFDCGRTDVQRMLGNAVPSLLAEVLASEIRFQLLGARRRSAKLNLLPPSRGAAPAPEIPADMPEKYWDLVGEHSAHPGTGKGFSRLRARAEYSANDPA